MTTLGPQMLFGLQRLMHNARYLIFALIMPVGFYILYDQMFGANRPFLSTTWGNYFMVSMATFGAIGTTLNFTGTLIAQDRTRGWVRYLRLTPIAPGAYIAAQIANAMMASLAVVALVECTAYLMNGLPLSANVVLAGVAVWLGSLTFAAIGLTLAHLLDATTINYGITLLYLGTAFLGGLWTPLKVLPPVFTKIADALPSYRMADVGWHLLAGQAPPWQDWLVLLVYLCVFGGIGGLLYARRG